MNILLDKNLALLKIQAKIILILMPTLDNLQYLNFLTVDHF